ncbi:hypothetical protein GY45DRAFT_504859 [Cubamyces sp. BRFM 1775]|nr:hypothetical protein GY45DRAFT_504859 [Cubamyces sp. BRFM 1775]
MHARPGDLPRTWRLQPRSLYTRRTVAGGRARPRVDHLRVRKACPGRHFADAMLFITIATVLHVFDVHPPLDEHGCPIEIKFEQSHGLLSFPEDSRCTVKPRSARAGNLLRESLVNDV